MTKFLLRSLDAHRSLMYCSLDNIPTYRDPVGEGGGNRVLMSSVTDRADQSRSDGASPQSGYGARFGVPPPPHPSNLQESTEVVRAGSNDGCCWTYFHARLNSSSYGLICFMEVAYSESYINIIGWLDWYCDDNSLILILIISYNSNQHKGHFHENIERL